MIFGSWALLAAALAVQVQAAPSLPQRETLEEAAYNAKKLVHNVAIGSMASVFPAGTDNAGLPFAILEYHAPCHPSPALTFALMPISLSTRNILESESHAAAYTVHMPDDNAASPMSRGRVTFIGNITVLDYDEIDAEERVLLKKCYSWYHRDSVFWLPYRKQQLPHEAFWAKFEPRDIYYVGGFGDTHYIGHIPIDVYTKAGESDDGFAPKFTVQA